MVTGKTANRIVQGRIQVTADNSQDETQQAERQAVAEKFQQHDFEDTLKKMCPRLDGP